MVAEGECEGAGMEGRRVQLQVLSGLESVFSLSFGP